MPLPTLLSGNVASATAGGYEIANSCRFNRPDSPYMHITPGSDGDLKIFTVSFWVKRGIANTGSSGTDRQVIFSNATNDQISFHNDNLCFLEDGTDSAITNMKFRDFSSWFHIVMAFDTSQSTNTNRQKVYVNGKQIDQSTGFSTMSYVAQDLEMGFGKGSEMMSVGRSEYDDNRHFDGYLAEFYYINGTMLDHTSFGEFDEDSPTIWKPKKFEGSFGTNGFYLDFEDSSNLGNDKNGGTDLTEVNLAAADQATDTPTNSFATLNPLVPSGGGFTPQSSSSLSEGNCFFETDNSSSNWGLALSTIGLTAGKWYFEVKATDAGDAQIGALGTGSTGTGTYFGSAANSYGYYAADGNSTTGGSGTSYGDSYTDNDIIGVYLDLDNNKIYWAKNGTVQNSGTGVSITAVSSVDLGAYFVGVGTWASSGNGDFQCNFGGCPAFSISSGNADANGYGNFEYDPSSGTFDGSSKDFLAICTKNLGSDGG